MHPYEVTLLLSVLISMVNVAMLWNMLQDDACDFSHVFCVFLTVFSTIGSLSLSKDYWLHLPALFTFVKFTTKGRLWRWGILSIVFCGITSSSGEPLAGNQTVAILGSSYSRSVWALFDELWVAIWFEAQQGFRYYFSLPLSWSERMNRYVTVTETFDYTDWSLLLILGSILYWFLLELAKTLFFNYVVAILDKFRWSNSSNVEDDPLCGLRFVRFLKTSRVAHVCGDCGVFKDVRKANVTFEEIDICDHCLTIYRCRIMDREARLFPHALSKVPRSARRTNPARYV